ncbi:hypothetical protein CCACVL1_03397 [Corchorus capsularis]|uniref:Uncharacterized protein n=1 Tax=Corchorus capsularis TaxID=210143 RepID=A0A1R3JZL5_COCAP|nr:hypothetical protein CCACVL1_03397 [Corchorus capsularis]
MASAAARPRCNNRLGLPVVYAPYLQYFPYPNSNPVEAI